MALDFSIEPFFDDYSEENKFYRILFRPGYAVQARELTQLQTILQEQVRRHGDHIFREGAMVIPGQIAYDLNLNYVKLAFSAGVKAENILSGIVGKEIKNSLGLIAKVITYTLKENQDLDTIFVKYQNSVQTITGVNVSAFSPNEILSPVDGSTGYDVTVADTGLPTGKGCSATIQRGVYYIKKNFVLVTDQTIILDKYTTTPSYRVGLKLNEEVIYPEDDENLLDNALGSPNYSAPGAARYYMDLVLSKIDLRTTASPFSDLNTSDDDGFIDLLALQEGKVIFKVDRTQYAELEKTLARRTYDESGDYSLSPFNMQVRELRNNLRGDWAPNEKFIQGDIIKVTDGSTGFWYFVAVTNGTSSNLSSKPAAFKPNKPTGFSLQTIDSITDNDITWEYVLYPDFNQGVYTFTAGDSEYSTFTLNDHIRLAGHSCIGVESGKAYVRGYEIEKLSTEFLPIQKSRNLPIGSTALATFFAANSLPAVQDSISPSKTVDIDVSSGSYVQITGLDYFPNLVDLPTVNLHSAVKGSISTGTVIGTARVRALEKLDTSNVSPALWTYNLFLFDVKMNIAKDFKNVLSITNNANSATAFRCNTVLQNGITAMNNPVGDSLIYALPDYAVSSILEATYSVVIPFTKVASSSKIEQDAPTGYTFESIFDSDNYVLMNNTTGVAVALVAGSNLTATSNKLTITGLTNTQSYTVFAAMKRSDAVNAEVNFTVTDLASPLQLTAQAAATATTITLGHPYVTRITSILMDARGFTTQTAANPVYSLNITSRYNFNSSQKSSHMDLASITLAPGQSAPTGPIRISYEYLATGSQDPGGFFGVNSYTYSDDSRMTYDQIYSVSNLSLRDSVDFRAMASGAGFALKYFPKYGTTASFKYTHYYSRIDNVSLTSTGQFILNRGVPSDFPSEPTIPANSMKLARLSVEPYTFKGSRNNGILVDRVENKRYTMRDIGSLERRIQDLEYYTSLTLTELETKNMRIVDADGNERYQNGFLVDSFDGQGVGNTGSEDWNASVDTKNKELRPFFSQKQVSLLENVSAPSRTYKVSGDLVTLPYTETELIAQRKGSISEFLNPYALYSWKGIVDINPWSDTWFATQYRPDIILTDESQYIAVKTKAEKDGVLGTVWNAWQTVFSSTKTLAERKSNLGAWSSADTEILNAGNNGGTFWRSRSTFTGEELDLIGNTNRDIWSEQSWSVAGSRVITVETSATETTQARAGVRSFIVDKVDSKVLDDRVVDTQIVPYIRPRAVLFTGYGFKPSTRMYSYFDNTSVEDYITPATRLKVAKIDGYDVKFDTVRNAGSAVSEPTRTVYYSDGTAISGTITLTQNSTSVEGLATAFTQQVEVGDILNVGTPTKYKVESITDNDTLIISPAWTAATESGVSAKVIGPKHTTEEVEVAFNHGEVIKEYANGVATGNTAIVVGQEVYGTDYYLHVLNIKGNGQFSTASNAYFEGEYLSTNGLKPRAKFVSGGRTDYTSLVSSLTGLITGIFRIPSSPLVKFRTGKRELRFSDSSSTNPATRGDQESTSGGMIYEANGLVEIKQRTILSTRTASVTSTQVSDQNTIVSTSDRVTRDTGWFDPLAQTFLVQQEGGAFITSVDLFFESKDEKIPMRIEIREVVNGYPGSAVIPFSRVEKKAASITTSTDSTIATTFTFPSPVFLQNGVEYALVALSDSNIYKIWISQTDTLDVATKVRISSQPYNGVLFKSQNGSTWTADQTQDMKFVIRRAVFDTSQSRSIELIPPKLSAKTLDFNPFNFISGSKKCRVNHSNHGMIDGEVVKFTSRQVIDSINGIPATEIFRNTGYTISNVELDYYIVEFPTASNASGQVGGSYITATENYEFQTSMIEIAEIVPPGTSISYSAKVINHSDVSSEFPMIPKENYTFPETKVYPSSMNYTSTTFPSGLSVIATLNPSSSLNSVSPVIDLGRLAMTLVSNKIDDPTLAVNDTELDYFRISGSNAVAATSIIQGVTYTIATPGTNYSSVGGPSVTTSASVGSTFTASASGSGLTGGGTVNSWNAEIGSGKPFGLVNNTDGSKSLTVDSLAQTALYNHCSNNLQAGHVLRFTYSGITNATRDMVIKSISVVLNGSTPVLYITLVPFDGVTTIQDTVNAIGAQIFWLSHFKSDYAPSGGSTHSKYVTKKINFSRPSEMLKIMFAAVIPPDANVEVYYKTGLSVSGDFIASSYSKAEPKSGYTKSLTEFTDITCDIEGLDAFDSVMVKLVMKSINKSQVPRIKDFRVIACAA